MSLIQGIKNTVCSAACTVASSVMTGANWAGRNGKNLVLRVSSVALNVLSSLKHYGGKILSTGMGIVSTHQILCAMAFGVTAGALGMRYALNPIVSAVREEE